MFGALLLFEDEFIHVVAISYTALILTELTMVTSTLMIMTIIITIISIILSWHDPHCHRQVALTIRTWHPLMVLAELLSILLYLLSLILLREFFGTMLCCVLSVKIWWFLTFIDLLKLFLADAEFIKSVDFVWKTAVITGVSCLPLYFIKFLRRRFSPPSYQKLQWGGYFQILLETTSPKHRRGCSNRLPQYASTLLF